MLVSSSKIIEKAKVVPEIDLGRQPVFETITDDETHIYVNDRTQPLTKSISKLQKGFIIHYYSFGNFNLVRLIVHLLKFTGPSHIFMSSYSFSQRSIETIQNNIDKKNVLSFKLVMDNRVRSLSPKPFQMIAQSFDYRCTAIHAKVALIFNDKWSVSVITSQNATDNPKTERGTIYTNQSVFEFDKNVLQNEYDRGTT